MANRFKVESIFSGKDKVSAPISRMRTNINKFLRTVRSGFAKAGRAVGKMTQGIFNLGKKLSLFGTIAIGAVGVMIKKFADAGDELAKLSKRVGMSVEGLQQWRRVSQLSGSSAEEFDKAVGKLAKGIGEARAGTGALFTFLKKSNPELLKQLLVTKDTGKAYELVINSLRGLTNAQDKLALSNAAFGRSGEKNINVATLSAKKIKELREETQRLGIITTDQAEQSEIFNDTLFDAKLALLGIRNVIGGELIPVLTPMVDKFKEFAIELRPKVEAFAKEFAAELPGRINSIVEGFKELLPLGKQLFEGLKNNLNKESLDSFIEGLKGVLLLMEAIGKVVNVIAKAFKIVGEGLGKFAGFVVSAFRGDFQGIADNASNSPLSQWLDQRDRERDADKNTLEAQGDLNRPQPKVVSPAERVSRSIEENTTINEDKLIIENNTDNLASLQTTGKGQRDRRGRLKLINTGSFA